MQHQNYSYGRCLENGCQCPAMIPVEGDPSKCLNCPHDIFIHVDLTSESTQEYAVVNETLCDQHLNNINSELNSQGYPVTNELVEQGVYDPAYFNQKPNPVREKPPPNTIWFYNRGEKYYEFTNFKEGYPIFAALVQPNLGEQPDCKRWPTSEHLFQAAKFKKEHPELCEHIRLCKTARDALNMARHYQSYVDPNWQDINVQVMEWVVTQKFEQHPSLASMLLSTGDFELVEHTEVDSFWGDGGGGNKGRNELGNVLMRVRKKLRERAQFHPEIANADHTEDNFVYMMPGTHTPSSSSLNQMYPDNSWAHTLPPPPLPPRGNKRDLNKVMQQYHQKQSPSQQQQTPQQRLTLQQQEQLILQRQLIQQQQQQQLISQQQPIYQQATVNNNNGINMYAPPQPNANNSYI